MTNRLVLAVVLLAVPWLMAPVIIQSGGAPPAGAHIQDLFTTDSDADWSEYGSWTVTIDGSDSNQFKGSGASGSSIHGTVMTTGDGYGCVELNNQDFAGIKFRAASDDSNRSYIVRGEEPNGDVVWRHCAVASCTTIETWAGPASAIQDGDYMGIEWSGTGSSTVIDWYIFDSGTGCTGCDDTTCDTSGWAAAASDNGQFTNDPPTGTYPELDTQRHVGLYNGDSTAITLDNFYAGDQ